MKTVLKEVTRLHHGTAMVIRYGDLAMQCMKIILQTCPVAPRFGNLKYPFIPPEIWTECYQPPQTDQTIQTVQMALAFHII